MDFPPMFREWCRREDHEREYIKAYQKKPETRRKRNKKELEKIKKGNKASILARKRGKDYEPGIALTIADDEDTEESKNKKKENSFCKKCSMPGHSRVSSQKCRFHKAYKKISDWLSHNQEVLCLFDEVNSSVVCDDCNDVGHPNESSLRCKKHPIFRGDINEWREAMEFLSSGAAGT